MEHVTIDDLGDDANRDGIERRRLSAALDAEHVAINHYRIPPGEGLPAGLHAHMDQEEMFLVLDGVATFETMAGEQSVAAGEAIRFAPGEFQSGRNGGAGDLVVLALGAPPDSEDVRLPVVCPDCGHQNLRLDIDESGITFVCPQCDSEHVPADCPACGSSDLRVTLDDEDWTVVACQACGETFDEPPLAE